jgi:hypothetical protein
MDTVAVSPGQNIFDIAVQEYGSIEGIKNMRELNGFSFTPDVTPGDKIIVSGDPVNKNVTQHLKLYPKIATGNDYSENILEGIGYWAIEGDFVVS